MKTRHISKLALAVLLVGTLVSILIVDEAAAVSGAAFTTFNARVDGASKNVCKNGVVNCNIYGAKEYVWLLIRKHDLPMKVLLGIWLDAEISNHEGCPWLEEPIPAAKLAANAVKNGAEIERGIELARRYGDIVVAVNVGNEALVEWNDHMVPLEKVIAYVRRVKAAVDQPVTVADNYRWWAMHGAPLAREVDFHGVHTYPVWEYKPIDAALAYTVEKIEAVRAALPGKPVAVLEAGWPTVASEFGDAASEENQARHVRELRQWAAATNTTVFLFEAFDEPWKGDPDNPLNAEKHWGLFNVDRTPKLAVKR